MSFGGSRGSKGLALLGLALLCLAVTAAPARAAEAAVDPAASMYQPSTVDVIKLTLPPASKKKLEEDPEGEYVEGTFSLAETDGTPETIGEFSEPITVGIRLKGSLGSLRGLNEKAAFKIKFSFVKHQTYLGLKKMTLNNMVQDPSMIHETLAYEAFRSVGVPGPYTGFAYLYVNEENYGLYLNIETVDQEFLEKRFGPFQAPPQHLYSGEDGTDVTVGGAGRFEVTEGEEEDRSDLEALIEAVNGTAPADFSERVAPYADLQEMTHEWAVEKYIGHWDGYAGREGFYWPNNYYLYSSATGVFQMLPWGTDQTWGERLTFDGKAGLLFNDCLEDESCATMYRGALREVQIKVPALDLDSLATQTAALLEPWQALEASPRQPYSAQEIHDGVEATRSFMAARPAELAAWLAAKPASHVAVSVWPGSILADGVATATATATVTNAEGAPVIGDDLSFSSSDAGERIGPVSDQGEGIYTAQITSSTTAGTATITATDNSATPAVAGTATLTQTPELVAPPIITSRPSATVPAATIPTVRITGKPPRRSRERRPTLRFVSSQPGATFRCKLDGRAYLACRSPDILARLARGAHVFRVTAVNAAGQAGPPASYRFVVKPRPPR